QITQKSSLAVSANGGPFTSIDTSKLLPGVQGASIQNVVATGEKLYVNLTYTGCAGQQCYAIVSSADGGKTWTHVSNLGSVELVGVATSTFYGRMPDAQNGLKVPAGTEVTST